MITVSLLSCFTIIVSAVPVTQRGASQIQQVQPVEATNQNPEVQTPAPLSPRVDQAQPGIPQQMGPQGGPQLVPSQQHYTWPPLGDGLMIIPLQPSFHGSQPANQPALPQQPLMFPPHGYFPLFSSPYRNQLFSPYGFPGILGAPLPQIPANQPPNSPVLPAETLSGAAPSGDAPQPIQQQQNPQIVYMLQQPMSSLLGSVSSEELQMAAKMGQLSMYVPTVLTNLPTGGGVQAASQAAGLTNQAQAGVVPTAVTPSGGVPQTERLASTGLQPDTDTLPVGLERAAQEAATVQSPVQPQLQPTQGNLI
ncbi:methyl-CpG-binding domain protein 6-like [Seriola lalandi dorsalis]|uniref:methyl-CpG-binding domain protein 6-like n=1 Tax=Seriola lalandi dorsalis TaxID=1841481 RepID=UPI000C6FB7C3|nr:methyl-CpG-binding domain protein 6-like [Seriola lalandi dorsalis]